VVRGVIAPRVRVVDDYSSRVTVSRSIEHGEVDWDEFLAWAVEHKLDRDDDDSDDESLLQAADVKKRPSVQKASDLQK